MLNSPAFSWLSGSAGLVFFLGGTRYYCSEENHIGISTTSVLYWPNSPSGQLHTVFIVLQKHALPVK